MPFVVELESIMDLFYDQTTDPEDEYIELCAVMESETGTSILESVYREPMNRTPFTRYAIKVAGIDSKTANEIFSCATNCFGAEGARSPQTGSSGLPDTDMTRSEFAHATVMLANIYALMRNVSGSGTTDASKLGDQF